MSDVIISVENLGKKYAIRHEADRARYKTLRETVVNSATRLLRRRNPQERARTREEFWAVRNVSFEVERGQVLGIIGRNGAGKSTLLKLLSRITEPSEGRMVLRGRVASLLEVGTGFHPELTGRENIFLNGSILGMGRAEIRRKFDEIVDFAGVEKFLDTPVKRYSSGMYVRLAFAVAAHLEPEILIVDEVLSVGDAEFQKKCLGKMQGVTRGGRTVLFVSHNLSAVRTLCRSALLLRDGHLDFSGSTERVIDRYIDSGASGSTGRWLRAHNSTPDSLIAFCSAELTGNDGRVQAEFDFQQSIRLRLRAQALGRVDRAQFAMRVNNQEGTTIFTTCDTDESRGFLSFQPGPIEYEVTLPPAFLHPGRYLLQIAAHIPKERLFDLIDGELSFVVHETGTPAQALNDERLGFIYPPVEWKLKP